MRRLKLKHTMTSEGRLSLQHQSAPTGRVRDVITYEITRIPNDVPDSEVVRLADATTFYCDRHVIDFSELGVGRIVQMKWWTILKQRMCVWPGQVSYRPLFYMYAALGITLQILIWVLN